MVTNAAMNQTLPKLDKARSTKNNANYIKDIYTSLEKRNLKNPLFEVQNKSLEQLCTNAKKEWEEEKSQIANFKRQKKSFSQIITPNVAICKLNREMDNMTPQQLKSFDVNEKFKTPIINYKNSMIRYNTSESNLLPKAFLTLSFIPQFEATFNRPKLKKHKEIINCTSFPEPIKPIYHLQRSDSYLANLKIKKEKNYSNLGQSQSLNTSADDIEEKQNPYVPYSFSRPNTKLLRKKYDNFSRKNTKIAESSFLLEESDNSCEIDSKIEGWDNHNSTFDIGSDFKMSKLPPHRMAIENNIFSKIRRKRKRLKQLIA
ncbi:unnamed protein product [Blepharisma stoltei]|uniref:Uncharacterized protein n=1 Tax=Blepharisma stoltei TaxID=1481888 RepID=A0AAU9JF10_9CILI|nr:unnamed protein product [Blepharisma stoltei]